MMKNITDKTALYFAKELKEYLDMELTSECVYSVDGVRSCERAVKNGHACEGGKQEEACKLSISIARYFHLQETTHK